MTPWLLFVKRQKKMLKLQNSWTNITFLRIIIFNQNMPLDARIAVVTIREKTFRLSVFLDQIPKKSERLYIFEKNDFPQLVPRLIRWRVSKISQSFAPEVRKSLRIGKKAKFSLCKNFFRLFPWTSFTVLQTLKNFSAIVPETSKIIRKSWSFQDFLSEILLWKCSSGHVESSFDNPAKNVRVKIQVFFVKVQKRRKTNCSRVFFDVFHLYT